MESKSILRDLHNYLITHQNSLAVAESCTGGLISDLITNSPGSSSYFLGGLIVYAEKLKIEILGVPEEIIQEFGVVSSEVAKEMVTRIKSLTGVDYAISTTGFAGPFEKKSSDQGYAYVGIIGPEFFFIKKVIGGSDRYKNKQLFAITALELLFSAIKENSEK